MPVKISELPVVTTVSGAEILPLVQSRVTKTAPINQFWAGPDAKNYAALAAAVTAAAGQTLTISTAVAVATNTTVPSTVKLAFTRGGSLVPAAGVTVTINGEILAGMQQIFNIAAAGSTVNCTNALVDAAYVEWWGVIGGDVNFSSGNAAINKPLIDAVLQYAPYKLLFLQKGIYSTTGHAVSYPHEFVGYPNSSTNAIWGSGIAFSDAANITGGDYSATKKYIFQNGASSTCGDECVFRDISIYGSDYNADIPAVIPIGVLASSLVNLSVLYSFENVTVNGFMGIHFTKSNNIPVRGCFLYGSFAAVGMSCPLNLMQGGSATVVQKVWSSDCTLQQNKASPVAGQIVYQANFRSDAPNGAIDNIGFVNCTFENGYNGFLLAAAHNTFINPHIERVSNTMVSGESTTYRSLWVNPELDVGTSALLSAIGANSMVITPPSIYAGALIISPPLTASPWTPTLTCGTSGTITITSPTGALTYTQLGNEITVSGSFAITSVLAPVGTLTLGGLPIACGNDIKFRSGGSFLLLGGTSDVSAMQFLVNSNATTVTLYTKLTAGVPVSDASVIQANAVFAFSFSYFNA